jgi:hypothetical protein
MRQGTRDSQVSSPDAIRLIPTAATSLPETRFACLQPSSSGGSLASRLRLDSRVVGANRRQLPAPFDYEACG